MPATGQKLKRRTKDNKEEDVFTVEFTDEALKQLKELQEVFEAKDLVEVVQFGISLLQKVKENSEDRESQNE